VLRQSGNLLIK